MAGRGGWEVLHQEERDLLQKGETLTIRSASFSRVRQKKFSSYNEGLARLERTICGEIA